MKYAQLVTLLAIALVSASAPAFGDQATRTSAEPLTRIAFGSCARQNQPQPIWHSIVKYKPQLFLFIGDNIYGDTEDMAVMKAKYRQLAEKPGFAKLRRNCRLLAVWDDHDYGENDAGREYLKKRESQQVFCDFFGVPDDSPLRKRPGIYDSHVFGPKGKRVQVILLDTRYFRTPLRKRPGGKTGKLGPYLPHKEEGGTILGPAQWKWLQAQLKKPAELRIIASSIQVVAWQHGWETWGNLPRERRRLFDLIRQTDARSVVFISGDRHTAEISRIDPSESGVAYPLYDVTSSSLNQPGGGAAGEPNKYRVGQRYSPINFGSITIDWGRQESDVRLAIHDGEGKLVREQSITIGDK